MSLHRLVLLTLAFAVPAAGAHAEDATAAPIDYRFDDDLVHGALQAPPNEVLFVRTRTPRESLVQVREHWLPELFSSVEDL
jgi:hypothetical protein